MDEWSGGAQERLKGARAIVVGAGALGSPAATYLAAAGVGTIGLVDGDAVELSNLHRQPLHFTPDVGAVQGRGGGGQARAAQPGGRRSSPIPVELDATQRRGDRHGRRRGRGLHRQVRDAATWSTTRAAPRACRWWRPGWWPSTAWCSRSGPASRPATAARSRSRRPRRRGAAAARPGVLGAMAGIVGSIQALEALKLLTRRGRAACSTASCRSTGTTWARRWWPPSRRPDCPACAQVPAAAQS